MKIITASTIGNLITAHLDGDNERFMAFAKFIAESYEEAGDYRSARIIRSHISNNKAEATVVLDEMEENKEKKDFQKFKAKAGVELDKWGSIFMKTLSAGTVSAEKFFADASEKIEKYANAVAMPKEVSSEEEEENDKKNEISKVECDDLERDEE